MRGASKRSNVPKRRAKSMNDWIRHRLSSPGAALRETDPEIATLIEAETRRQREGSS